MSLMIDDKYISRVGGSLRNFKRKSSILYTFSCPYCGDSKYNKYKTRGFFYISQSNEWNFKCHNCGLGRSFNNFVKEQVPDIYKEYRLEKFQNKKTNEVDIFSVEDLFDDMTPTNDLDTLLLRCDNLSNGHPAVEYLKGRGILLNHERFYYSTNLNALKQIFPGYDNLVFKEDNRIVFPIKNISNKLIGVVCRALRDNARLRYMNLRKGNDPLIYNIENIDFSSRKYVVEGPIDSLFIPNCVAAIGSDLMKCREIFDDNTTYVFDNQPKNTEIVKKMEYLVKQGCSVVVWPTSPAEKEDINDMVKQHLDVMDIINTNTYKGITATAKIGIWRKI